ncbi:unnamed protein product [Miscanthus lutarioriparius]|uniref:Uncharacterized protein n=1 Tax=Miscanthus lutarioriparius TaxID=422564 RepID=A0A811RE36_9POAL|nr:unnamed protein product [Miscanthus lutarioriparius]
MGVHSRNAPAGDPGGGLVRRCRRIRFRCSVSHFRTVGRDEKGLAHLAILLRRVGAVAGDRGGGGGRWRRVGGATPASGGVRPIDGSGLRRTEPRSRGGGRGVARSREGVARGRGGGGARRRPRHREVARRRLRCRGLVRASHEEEEEEEAATHEEWARRDETDDSVPPAGAFQLELRCTSTLSSSAFSSRPKRVRTPCSLNLINRTDGYANYWVIPQFPEIYSIDKLSFILGPMSTGTLNVTMVEQEQPPLDLGIFKILMIAMGSERELKDLVSCIGNEPEILKLVEELGEDVHSAIVAAVDCQPRERSSPPKTVSSVSFTSLGAIDVHPTKPWILAGGNNYLTIWDQNEEATVFALDVNEEGSTVPRLGIVAVIFIPRKQCSTLSYFTVKFNPNNTETFTSGDRYSGLKVWSINAPNKPITTIQQYSDTYIFYDHVFTEASQNHVVVGKDGRLNIWDLQTGTRVHTLYETGKYFNTAIACHPTLPLIVACVYSKDSPGQPLVRFWNSTNYRKEVSLSICIWCINHEKYFLSELW